MAQAGHNPSRSNERVGGEQSLGGPYMIQDRDHLSGSDQQGQQADQTQTRARQHGAAEQGAVEQQGSRQHGGERERRMR